MSEHVSSLLFFVLNEVILLSAQVWIFILKHGLFHPFKWTIQAIGPIHERTMITPRAATGAQQVITTADVIQMRPFGPYAAISMSNSHRLGQCLACSNIQLILNNMRLGICPGLYGNIHFPVVIK